MKTTNTFNAFSIALAITTLWTFFNRYEYRGRNVYLLDRINVFPFVLWTIGLTTMFIVYTRIKSRYRFLLITLLYWIALGALEAFGYYTLNIRLNSDYPSLFNMGIIHAPNHMKFFYIFAGPMYIALTEFLLQRISYTSAQPESTNAQR